MAKTINDVDTFLTNFSKAENKQKDLLKLNGYYDVAIDERNTIEKNMLSDKERELTEDLIIQTITNLLLQVSNEVLTIKS
ncbi:MAG: hypothetical protein ORN58_00190 [Sediminibacterium sp.]|nr:hypothetical protein [Sediminibacterium sp.]